MSVRTWIYAKVEIVRRPDDHYGLRVVYRKNGPKIFNSLAPDYPKRALKLLKQADLLMEVRVNSDGSLDQIHMVDSRGDAKLFVNSLRKTMKRWHASPMLVNGKPAISHVRLHVSFKINDRDQQSHQQTDHGESAWEDFPRGVPVAVDSPLQAPVGANPSA